MFEVEFHDASNEICRVEACLQHAHELVMQVNNLVAKEKEYFGLLSKNEIANSKTKLKTQILEAVTKHVENLHVYNVNISGSHLIFSTLKLIPHHLTYALTTPEYITITLFLVCNLCFHYKAIIMASCGCTYHAWCLGFHMKIFR